MPAMMTFLRSAATALACLFVSAGPALAQPAVPPPAPVDFATAQQIIKKRCAVCHTAIPQEDGLSGTSQPPKGVKFDTPADIRAFAPRIFEQTVGLRKMPPDNATHMKDEERAALGQWFTAGAPMP
ncbi:hypothetical protein BH10PSE13_BH10PSE13_24140 [soil metagenome]